MHRDLRGPLDDAEEGRGIRIALTSDPDAKMKLEQNPSGFAHSPDTGYGVSFFAHLRFARHIPEAFLCVHFPQLHVQGAGCEHLRLKDRQAYVRSATPACDGE